MDLFHKISQPWVEDYSGNYSLSINYPRFQNCWNAGYLLNITFYHIYRRRHTLASVGPVKYERD